jgi:hypothetical protein
MSRAANLACLAADRRAILACADWVGAIKGAYEQRDATRSAGRYRRSSRPHFHFSQIERTKGNDWARRLAYSIKRLAFSMAPVGLPWPDCWFFERSTARLVMEHREGLA